MNDQDLGRRIAYWRERRGMTQQLFADRLGRSKSWVEKVEAGRRNADRLTVLEDICEVLRVDLPVLLGRELPRDTQRCIDNAEVEAIRSALERYEEITPHTAPHAEPPDLATLRRQCDYVWHAFESAAYEVVGKSLPGLLHQSQRAHREHADTRSAGLLAEVYQVTASTARKLGEFELAWIAGDRGISVAEESGDRLLTATAAFRVANALLAIGRADAAFDLNISFVDSLGTDLYTPSDLSVYGTMLLQASMAGARNGNNSAVRDLVREAEEIAKRTGPGRNDYHTAFGPANVAIHHVSALVELGEGGTAVEAAARIPRQELEHQRRERHANHLVDVARGYSQWGKRDQALAALLDAEQLAAAEVRCRPVARATITDLVKRSRGVPSAPLRQLANRAGVAA